MTPIVHPSTNTLLGAPEGWEHDRMPCDALPATRVRIEGQPGVMSFWKPTADELELLAAGGSVALCVYGGGMPAVALSIEPAFELAVT